MGEKMYPKLTTTRRALERFLKVPSNVKLDRLDLFVARFMSSLRSRKSMALTPSYLDKMDFPQIATAFRQKNVSIVQFSLDDNAQVAHDTARESMIAKAIEIAVQELATYGIRKNKKALSFSKRDKESNNLKCELFIQNQPGIGVSVKIIISFK